MREYRVEEMMIVDCVWEHNGNDSLLYAANYPGAYTRGSSREIAEQKMRQEICANLMWKGELIPERIDVQIVQEAASSLDIRDADSDVLFLQERQLLSLVEYQALKRLALKSAMDFQKLYDCVPDKDVSSSAPRKTFYGAVPRTANEMYMHTKSVNAYYFGEIDVEADNEGSIVQCRENGFIALEKRNNYLLNPVFEGSYGEAWTLCKVIRRFLWHDRIHAKAMYRMALRAFGEEAVPDVFYMKMLGGVNIWPKSF